MAEIDKAKQNIAYLKFWLGAMVAVFVSIASWIVNNYLLDNFLVLLASVVEVALVVIIYFTNKRIVRKINELKDM